MRPSCVVLLCALAAPVAAQAPSPTPDPWGDLYGPRPEAYRGLFDDLIPKPASPDDPPPASVLPVPPTVAAGLWDRLAFRGTAIRLHNEGVGLEANGRTADAARKYGEAVASWPAFPEAQYGLGAALVRLRQPDQALVHFREALRLRPGYVEASRGVTITMNVIAYRNRPEPPETPEVIVHHRR